ncbi:hypothetical protein C0995_011260 [Termitomyces sp. Mi166|nr:hypothetical protein C0995_011260 [Termitomyces sp. Mi166\
MLGSQPSKNSNQLTRNGRVTANSVGPSNEGNQPTNSNNGQGSTSQPRMTNLHNESSGFSSTTIADAGDDTEPEDNNKSPNSNGRNKINTPGNRTLSRSRPLDPVEQDQLMALILEAAEKEARGVKSVVGARPNQPSEPTTSASVSRPALTIPTAPSSPVITAEAPIISMAHELTLQLAAASASNAIPQNNFGASSAAGGSHFAGAMDPNVVAARHEGVTVDSMVMSEDTRGTSAQASSAFPNETASAFASSALTNGISAQVSSAFTNASSIQTSPAFAFNGAQPFASAEPNGPGPFTSSNEPNLFFSTNTGETAASSVEVDMDIQDSSASQVNTSSLLSRISPPTDSFGAPTVNFVNPNSSSGSAPSVFGAFGPMSVLPASGAFSSIQTNTFGFVNPGSSNKTGQGNTFGAIGSNNAFPALSAFSSLQSNNFFVPTNTFVNPNPFSGFDSVNSSNAFGPARQTASAFGSNAFPGHQTNTPFFPVSNTWNGDNRGQRSNGLALDSLPNDLSGMSNGVSSPGSAFSLKAAASPPRFSNNINSTSTHSSSSYGLNSNADWKDRKNTVTHPLNFDFSTSGFSSYNNAQFSFPSDANSTVPYAWTTNSVGTLIPDNDVEMEVYDPPGGFYGLEGIHVPISDLCPSDLDTLADVWNDLVIPPFSFELTSPVPFRQRSAPPPTELSSIDLDSQLDWIQDNPTLSSPESPSAAAVVYDNTPTVMPSLFEDDSEKVAQYVPFPWPTNGCYEFEVDEYDDFEDQSEGEQVNNETDEIGYQPEGEQTNDETETDEVEYQPEEVQMDDETDEIQDQPGWEQTIDKADKTEYQAGWELTNEFGFYPPFEPASPLPENAVDQTPSPFQPMHYHSRDTSCFRPFKKLANAMGWAVHRYIGHRVECDCP